MTKKVGEFGWRGMRLVAVGTVAAYTAMGMRMPALAQTAISRTGKTTPEAQLPVRRFEIAAGPLKEALTAFEKTTGVTVELKLTKDLQGAGLQSPGVTGLYSNTAALKVLLAGTGLTYEFHGADAVVVGIQHMQTVNVTASLPDAVGMEKFTEPLLDTPQSITVVPQFVMENQGTSTLRDALRNVPGISLAAGEAGAQGDNLTIRGFTARNDIFLDGIRDFGSYYRDSFDYEQVDVLEGPAGVQFGRGSTGGVINQESKVPDSREFVHVETQFGTDLTRRITADINEPLPDVANGTAVRVNFMAQEGGVAGRDQAEIRRFGLAPTVESGMNGKTRTTLSYEHLTESDTPDYGLPWLNNGLAQGVNRHSYFGFGDENYLKTNDDIVTAKVSHDVTPNINVHTVARWANYPRSAQITEPQICSNPSAAVPVGAYVTALPTSAVNTALTCAFGNSSAPATIVVNRNQIQTKSVEGILWDQMEVTARFKVLGIRNDFLGGVEGGQEISNPIRYSYTINKINTVPSTMLVGPNEQAVFGGTGYVTSIVHTKAESVGIYFVDTMRLGRLFELSGGVRWDRFDTGYSLYQPTPPTGGTVTAPASFSRVDAQPDYRAAFVYKPNSHGSVYFDYGTSFDPSAEALSLSAGSVSLPPEENETYEVGSKWNFLRERLLLEGAWFRTQKNNAKETDPTNSNNIVLAGNQLVKGVQFSVVGRLRVLDVIAGYAYLDSSVLSSMFYPTSIGYPLANVPKQTFNAFVTRRIPWTVDVGIGGNYVASRTASSTVPFVPTSYGPPVTIPGTATQGYQVLSTARKQVPGYWIFNAMVKRPLTERVELQANVYNALNRFYIDLPHPSHLVPGAGTSALIGINFKF